MMEKKNRFGVLPIFSLFALWEAASRLGFIRAQFYPPPSRVFTRLIELSFHDPIFAGHIVSSGGRFLLGALIGIPLAIVFALASELSPKAARLIRPCVAMTYPIPKIAIFPLLLVVFGVGDAPHIAIITIGIFFLVYLAAAEGLRRVFANGYMEIAFIYRIPFAMSISRILLRGALLDILNGIRAGLGYGLVMVVAGEFTIGDRGIGVFLWNSWSHFRIIDVYCGLALLSFAGLAIFYGVEACSRVVGESD